MRRIKMLVIIIYLFFVIVLGCFIYSFREYENIQVKKLVIESSDIPNEFNGKKILFMADFQYDTKKKFNQKVMQKVITLANEQEYDILMLGGDYTNWTGKRERFYNELMELKIPEYGAYAVLGNHDYNNERANIDNLERLNYKVLLDTNQKLNIKNDYIYISGISDLWHGNPDTDIALNGIDKNEMTIEQRELADITLAGHVHAGQVSFFGLFALTPTTIKTSLFYRYGMKEINGNKMYVTSGLGGNAFSFFIRFFAKPEIVIIELKKI